MAAIFKMRASREEHPGRRSRLRESAPPPASRFASQLFCASFSRVVQPHPATQQFRDSQQATQHPATQPLGASQQATQLFGASAQQPQHLPAPLPRGPVPTTPPRSGLPAAARSSPAAEPSSSSCGLCAAATTSVFFWRSPACCSQFPSGLHLEAQHARLPVQKRVRAPEQTLAPERARAQAPAPEQALVPKRARVRAPARARARVCP